MSFRVMMHAAHHLFCMLASFTIPDLCSPFKASLCACFCAEAVQCFASDLHHPFTLHKAQPVLNSVSLA